MRLDTSDDLYIHPIGDNHIGHTNSNIERLEEELDSIPNNPNHRILLMGDLIDCGTKDSIGASAYEQTMNPNKQLNAIVNLFSPFADQIDGSIQGNHEYRIMKTSGIDVMEQFCNQLDIPYLLYSGMVTYSIGMNGAERAYNINMFHGTAGGGVANALNKCKAMSNKAVADVYLMG